jgi:predicted secreted protein
MLARLGRGSKGVVWAAAAMLAVLALTVSSALAAEPRERGATVLHLSEPAERMVPRDRLRAVLHVEATDADPAKVQAEVNRRLAAAVARAKAVSAVATATTGYSVYQERPNDKPPQWHGTATLSLEARDASALLALVGGLQQDGLALASLAYELTPEAARTVEDELTTQALARLKARAERVATALGLTVERVREVTVGNANGAPPPPRPYALAARAMAADATAPVAEPGEAPVSITLSADFVLVPKR